MKEKSRRILIIVISILTLLLSVFLFIRVSNNNENKVVINNNENFIEIRDNIYDLFVYGVDIYSDNTIEFIDSGSYENIFNYYHERTYAYSSKDEDSGSHIEYARQLLEYINVDDETLSNFNFAYDCSLKLNELEIYAMALACEYHGYDMQDMPDYIRDSISFDIDDTLTIDEKKQKASGVISNIKVDGFDYSYNQYMNLLLDSLNEFKNSEEYINNDENNNLDIYKYDFYFALIISIYISAMVLLEIIDILINKDNKSNNIINELIIILTIIIFFIINIGYLHSSYTGSVYENIIGFNLKNYRFVILSILLIFVVINIVFKLKKNDKELENIVFNDNETVQTNIDIKDNQIKEEEIKFEYIDNIRLNRKLLVTTTKVDLISDINALFDSVDDNSLEKYDVLKDKSDEEIKDLFS